jgi:hypothetical protein
MDHFGSKGTGARKLAKIPAFTVLLIPKGCNFNRTDKKMVAILCKNNYNLLREHYLYYS